MELYYKFRQQQTWLIVGSKLFEDDRTFMVKDMKIQKDDVMPLTTLPKFGWTFIHRNKYRSNKQKGCASQLILFRSPSGQPRLRR